MIYQTTNTRCIIEAAKRLGLPYKIFDDNGNLVLIETGNKKLFFANYSTPFNSDSFSKIAKDKGFTSLILDGVINVPKSVSIFDPTYNEGGEIVSVEKEDLPSLLKEKIKSFSLPAVVKPNSLSRGRNFLVCRSFDEVLSAVKKVFNRDQNYDYSALIQEYIEPKIEYRVVILKNKLMLVYTVKQQVTDEKIIEEINGFVRPIFSVLDIGFAGLDIVEDKNGKKYLLELNSRPGFSNFVSKNGDEPIIEMYLKILGMF